MGKINFSYNAVTHSIDVYCGEQKMDISIDELQNIKNNVDNTISSYKIESIKHFNNGDYVVDDKNHYIFIYKWCDYSHNHCAFPSRTANIHYHCRKSNDGIRDNDSFISDQDVVYRKADPEEIAYLDYLMKKRGVYFDKKDKIIKKL